jgi:hypothetical protein
VGGVRVTISLDGDATLWLCNLLGGACTNRILDLETAGPETELYYEVGKWAEDEYSDEGDLRPR